MNDFEEFNVIWHKIIECDTMQCAKILLPQLVANINPKKMKPIEIKLNENAQSGQYEYSTLRTGWGTG